MIRRMILAALSAGLGLAALLQAALATASLVPYRDASDLVATTPSTDDGALGAMVNPAQWGLLERPELSGFWASDLPAGAPSPWGLAMGRGLGFSMRRAEERLGVAPGWSHVTDYQIGLGFGSEERATGMALGFSGPGKAAFDRSSFLTFGSIRRPTRWLSTGSTFRLALGDRDMDGVTDVGIRPLSDPRLVLFGSYAEQGPAMGRR
jgi:hypothetical protein